MKFKSINQNTQFIRAYRKGASYVTPLLVTYVIKNRWGHVRIGITSSKKIGGAVQRNRARRVIRAAVRALNLDMNQGYDIIFVARSKTTRCKSWQLEPLIKQRLTDAGVINAEKITDISNQAL
ncbi:MAG: ribonuclease P protein component [Oscillospiraceae bacterium]|nr:ribonuclease P protein component [Oscillospiraceae bacterium]